MYWSLYFLLCRLNGKLVIVVWRRRFTYTFRRTFVFLCIKCTKSGRMRLKKVQVCHFACKVCYRFADCNGIYQYGRTENGAECVWARVYVNCINSKMHRYRFDFEFYISFSYLLLLQSLQQHSMRTSLIILEMPSAKLNNTLTKRKQK